MNETIMINNQQIERLEYRRNHVITLPMVDQLHERPAETAGRSFRENRERFIEQEDYFMVPYEEWNEVLKVRNSSVQKSGGRGGRRGDMIFLTESGYLMLVKSFNDDLAWRVQRELVNRYFRGGDSSLQRKLLALLAMYEEKTAMKAKGNH